MFFKFARDTPDSMYGGQEFAMKASGHELKSLNQLIGCLVPKGKTMRTHKKKKKKLRTHKKNTIII